MRISASYRLMSPLKHLSASDLSNASIIHMVVFVIWCVACSLPASPAAGEPPAINLLQNDAVHLKPIGCEISRRGESVVVNSPTPNADALVDIALGGSDSQNMIAGPTAIEFEVKTRLPIGDEEYVVFFCTADDATWSRFQRVPVRPDGEWHTYRLPLSATSPITGLRMAFGRQPQNVELRSLRLVQLAASLPADLEAERKAMPGHMLLADDVITFTVNCLEHTYTVQDVRTGRTWVSEPLTKWLSLYHVERVGETALELQMYDHFSRQIVRANVRLQTAGTIGFTIVPTNPEESLSGARFYPPRFRSALSDGQIVFCDRSCGVLLDQRDNTYASWPMRVYGSTHCLDMPWIGLFDDTSGDGMMLLLETPADAEVALVADDRGCHWPEVRWLPSMDSFRYPRKATITFTTGGRHVELAKCYREYLQASGKFRTLAEKAADRPEVERLKGAASLWAGRVHAQFIREMRPLGVDKGIVNTSKDPAVVRWLNDQGYLTGRYDSYTDIRPGSTGFQRDDVALTAVQQRPGGPPKRGWTLDTGEYYHWRSSALWDAAASAYVEQELAWRPYNARFVDVAAAAELLEDYHPQHTFDRRQDLSNRRALFERMNQRGLVLGTEHGNDWVIDLVDYFEGSMSGPFWWSSWPAGHLKQPTREQLSENYLKYGIGYEHRIPLWELVYHDCAVTTWYWGDTAGMLYKAAPELADRKDLFNILYGTPPLMWMDGTGYKLPEDLHRFLRTYHDTCHLHEHVAFEQMLEHEFLSDDKTVQRTRFGNGTPVVVNFADEPRTYTHGKQTMQLAPLGYFVEGPGFTQSRLLTSGGPVTLLQYPDFLAVASEGGATVAGVRANGRVMAFRTGDDRWNVVVDTAGEVQLNAHQITGWTDGTNLAVHTMDNVGEVGEIVARADESGVVRFTASDEDCRFVLSRDSREPHVATIGSEEPAKDGPG